jgi:cytochrome c2
MHYYRRLAAVSVLAFSIAACGAPAEEEEGAVVAEQAASGEAVSEAGEAATETGADVDEAAAEGGAAPEQAAAPVAPPASFTQCQVCHQTAPGQNGIGPSLAGIFGRPAAQVSNFSYTAGMRSSGLTWDEATLERYIANPSEVVPGTTMAVGSLSDEERAEIIEYLKTL